MKISWSKIEKYLICPKYYYYYYVCGYRNKYISSALFFGTKLGETWQQILLKKKENLTDNENKIINIDPYKFFDNLYEYVIINDTKYILKDCLFVHYFLNDYDEKILNEEDILLITKYKKDNKINENLTFQQLYPEYKIYKLSETNLKYMNYMFWVSTRRKAYMLIESYINNIYPLIVKVYRIEGKIILDNQKGDILEGFLDVDCDINYDGKIERTIIDHKTSSQKYSKDSLEKKQQLAIYSYSEDINNQGYIIGLKKIKHPKIGLNKGKNIAEIQILIGKISEKRQEEVIKQIDNTLQRIKNEEFNEENITNCRIFGFQCCYYKVCKKNGQSDYLFIKKGENINKKWD